MLLRLKEINKKMFLFIIFVFMFCYPCVTCNCHLTGLMSEINNAILLMCLVQSQQECSGFECPLSLKGKSSRI